MKRSSRLPRHTPLARARSVAMPACDCGHEESEHYLRGACDACACTWYAPNVRAVRSRIARKKRSAAETQRIYGSPERVAWVKSLPCAGCGVVGYSDNAHVCGNGGMGRKAGYETIAPLCPSCHRQYDRWEEPFDVPDVRGLVVLAAWKVARAWDAKQERVA